jgi:hypothetical protein
LIVVAHRCPGGLRLTRYSYRGKTSGSLSAIAKKITGTHWSGPLSFGTGSEMTAPPKPTVRCALDTRKSSEEGLDHSFNSLHARICQINASFSRQRLSAGETQFRKPPRTSAPARRGAVDPSQLNKELILQDGPEVGGYNSRQGGTTSSTRKI